MQLEVFRNYIGIAHEIELSRILDMPRNSSGGIDLLDVTKGVEVKGCLINPTSKDFKKNYVKWTLFDHQLYWDKKYNIPLYCAVGTYQLDISTTRIRTTNPNKLESHVTRREFWIVPWNWTLKFPINKGKYHDYRYLRKNPAPSTGIPPIPKTRHTKIIPKGLLHFTDEVNMKHFSKS